ncbi:hypothetical protein EBQ34_07500 [Vandammella animalimorsus]|uniref:Uncharacterized protein n=1 Tax=Vandammella animalimorsus TaxID=2029117 RepID=A0A3M6RJ20_9BURK|nr:hypothetical protein EBQ34_07500 [Vandammella animalimorsus]
MRLSVAAVFSVNTRNCRVENACKVSNLARVFALHLRLLPRKAASQTQSQPPLALARHTTQGLHA